MYVCVLFTESLLFTSELYLPVSPQMILGFLLDLTFLWSFTYSRLGDLRFIM